MATARAAASTSDPSEATLRKLFGGAMECLLPAAFVDVSDLRQVPDHQEVFASKEDGVSIIIEVLSFETDIETDNVADEEGEKKGGESARHFFDDLADANGASSSTCDFCVDLTDRIMPKLASYSKSALAGRQTVAKFREGSPPEAVRVYVVNVRLPHVGTDLLITVNVPYPNEESAATSMSGVDCFSSGDTPPPPNQQRQQQHPPMGGDDETGVNGGVAALRTVLRSFDILDWSLFG